LFQDFRVVIREIQKEFSRYGRWPFYRVYGQSTPCRISKDPVGLPWFRLDNQFMDVRRMRLLSGPPDCRGYAPVDLESADRAFVWYAFAKTFAALGYPMWADADAIWAPAVPNV